MGATHIIKKHNPWLFLCPCCGESICGKCGEIEERFNNLCGCDECNRYQRRLAKRQQEHLDTYEHPVAEEDGR